MSAEEMRAIEGLEQLVQPKQGSAGYGMDLDSCPVPRVSSCSFRCLARQRDSQGATDASMILAFSRAAGVPQAPGCETC